MWGIAFANLVPLNSELGCRIPSSPCNSTASPERFSLDLIPKLRSGQKTVQDLMSIPFETSYKLGLTTPKRGLEGSGLNCKQHTPYDLTL